MINPFPHGKILDLTKLKAFADDKLSVTKMIISVFDRVENIVGKGGIACTSNFSFSHNVFKRLLSQRCQKVSLCGNGLIRRQILDSSKLKEFADDNFKFDENGRKLSKWVENTVGKGEIAR